MKKVKSFFGKIFDWIRSNAWIQPLLFVAIIFILILGIRAIGKASQKSNAGCSKKNDEYVKRVLMETVEDYIEDDSKNFILYIGRKNCGGCQSIQSTLKGFHKQHPDTTIYYLSLDYTGEGDDIVYKDATITESGLKSIWALIKPTLTDDSAKDSELPVTPTIAAIKAGSCVGSRVGGGSAAGITLQDIVDLKDALSD